jgi:hypothetical protein
VIRTVQPKLASSIVRRSELLQYSIPTLTAIPMTVFNARALASLVTAAGNALSQWLSAVIPGALVKVYEDNKDKEFYP